nr:hypothetical protein [Tanacetum cinerariifolium]
TKAVAKSKTLKATSTTCSIAPGLDPDDFGSVVAFGGAVVSMDDISDVSLIAYC